MVLANDNFWGYTTCLLFKYQVTWIEAAIVQPCWTSMLVCYVEGDEGHLLGEHVQQQTHRTRVRGTAHSFHMPWEDILHELYAHTATDTSDITFFTSEPRMLEVYPEGASARGAPEHGEGSETADCASIRLAPAPILLDRAQSRGLQE